MQPPARPDTRMDTSRSALLPRPLLIYIHGFISSPESEKAEELRQFVRAEAMPIDLRIPPLSNDPDQAYAQLVSLVTEELADGRQQIALIGSSLGGFWATLLVERFGLRAVLINPAVNPHLSAPQLLGEHQNLYTGEGFTLTEKHVEVLHSLALTHVSRPQNLWLMVQIGDETLDYRQAVAYYPSAKQTVEEGGDHRFQSFDRHLPAIMAFLGLPPS